MCLPVKPFLIEKEWEAFGLKCAAVVAREHMHRCGYVRVPPKHSTHGKHYDDVDVEIHGGLTFSEIESCEHEDGIGYWFGFDCAHCFDAMYEPGHEPDFIKKLDDEWRAKHGTYSRDTDHYWTLDEVVAETERLAKQLAAR
jgi:hypothetical protein